MGVDGASPFARPPWTWVLTSHHAGDNTQLLSLAEALDWPFEVKRFVYRPYQVVSRLLLGATLSGLDCQKSSPLDPPYPDLIIGAGRPTEPIAFWIRRYCNPMVRLVYLGTPWAPLDRFDLIITTPQYRLPVRDNVLQNALPLHGVQPGKLGAVADLWRPRLAHLPRPWIGVLVGGRSGPYTFGSAAAERLGKQATAIAKAAGGSLLVTTSARTSSAAVDALFAAIAGPSHLFRWTPAAPENPLDGYLALSDQFIVTGDSISMITEACATGKPVVLFDIEEGWRSMRFKASSDANQRIPPPYWRGADWNSTAFRLAMRFGPAWWTRDIRIVQQQLLQRGMVRWLGDSGSAGPSLQHQDMRQPAIARIHALFNSEAREVSQTTPKPGR